MPEGVCGCNKNHKACSVVAVVEPVETGDVCDKPRAGGRVPQALLARPAHNPPPHLPQPLPLTRHSSCWGEIACWPHPTLDPHLPPPPKWFLAKATHLLAESLPGWPLPAGCTLPFFPGSSSTPSSIGSAFAQGGCMSGAPSTCSGARVSRWGLG